MNLYLALLFVLLNFSTKCLLQHNIAIKDTKSLTTQCLNHVVGTAYKPGDLILVSDIIFEFHYPVIYYDWNKIFKDFTVVKMDIAIMSLEENVMFEEIIQNMSEEQFFDPAAKFIVLTNSVTSQLLEVSSKFYLVDIIFIEYINSSFQSIYTYEPFQNENSSFIPKNYKFLAQCRNGVPNHFNFFGNYRLPNTWKNSTINVIYNVIAPYFQCPTCESSIEAYLLQIVSSKLGFKVNYAEKGGFRYWGNNINRKYENILKKLYQRKCDMVVGGFHSKFEEHLDFDMSFTFLTDGLSWLVPTAIKLSGWNKLAMVVNFKIYLILLSTIVVVSIVCKLFYKGEVLYYLFVLYRTLLEVAVPRLPRHRIIYAHIIITFLTISTFFKGSLIHLLSVDFYDRQIRTLADIKDSNLSIYIDHDIAQYFRNNDTLDKYVYENYKFCRNPREFINRTAFQKDVVTVDFQRAHEYHLPKLYVDSEGKPLLYLFRTPIFPLYIHWYFVKGFPIFPQIDDVLKKLKSTGIVHHLCDRISFKSKFDMSRKMEITSNILKLKEVETLFVLLGFGLFLGIIVFFVEVGTAFIKRKVKIRGVDDVDPIACVN